jgi:hypothetical protein
MFEGCLAPSSAIPKALSVKVSPSVDPKTLETNEDVALSNLEGDGALVIAERWADKGKLRKKLEIMQQYLREPELKIVKRILGGQMYEPSQCSSDVEDIWETRVKPHVEESSSKFKSKALTKAAEKSQPSSKPGKDQGSSSKASHAETAAALSRLRVPRRTRSYMDSDEETEYHEEAHTEAAEYFFSHLRDDQFNKSSSPFPSLSSPSQKENQTESPKKLSQTIGRTPLGVHVKTPQGLLTPRSRQTSQKTPTMNPVSLLTPLTQFPRRQPQDSTPRTPHRSRTTTLGSPIRLRSNDSRGQASSSKQQSLAPLLVQSRVERGSPTNIPLTRSSMESSVYPFASIKNLGKRPAETVVIDLTTPKRKKTEPELKTSSKKDERIASHVPRVKDFAISEHVANPVSSAREAEHTTQSSPKAVQPLAASSSRKILTQEEREMRRDERYELAEKLSIACPDLAGPNFKRRLERHKSRMLSQRIPGSTTVQQTKTEPVITQEKTQSSTLPSREKVCQSLSLMPPGAKDEVEVDLERVARLANAFKAQFAKGIRPGLVVPRLACLESQEEED